jgi:hypothetical protein
VEVEGITNAACATEADLEALSMVARRLSAEGSYRTVDDLNEWWLWPDL